MRSSCLCITSVAVMFGVLPLSNWSTKKAERIANLRCSSIFNPIGIFAPVCNGVIVSLEPDL